MEFATKPNKSRFTKDSRHATMSSVVKDRTYEVEVTYVPNLYLLDSDTYQSTMFDFISQMDAPVLDGIFAKLQRALAPKNLTLKIKHGVNATTSCTVCMFYRAPKEAKESVGKSRSGKKRNASEDDDREEDDDQEEEEEEDGEDQEEEEEEEGSEKETKKQKPNDV